MTERPQNSMFGILSWMKEHQPGGFTSLDELSATFDVTREQMRSQLQSLQREECVKRGGRENAEWSITEHGLLRLAEGGFSRRGAFLPPFAPRETSSENPPDRVQPVTVIAVPIAGDKETPDGQDAWPSPGPTSWPRPPG